jgi:hypothetical protein
MRKCAPSGSVKAFDKDGIYLGEAFIIYCGVNACGNLCSGDPEGTWCQFFELSMHFQGIKTLQFDPDTAGLWVMDNFVCFPQTPATAPTPGLNLLLLNSP